MKFFQLKFFLGENFFGEIFLTPATLKEGGGVRGVRWVTGGREVTGVRGGTRGRYPLSYLECLSHQDSENIAHCKCSRYCLGVLVFVFVFVFVFVIVIVFVFVSRCHF